jgi:hypothetical protein
MLSHRMKNRRRYLTTAGIVLAGWSIALPIYWLAAPEAADPLDVATRD